MLGTQSQISGAGKGVTTLSGGIKIDGVAETTHGPSKQRAWVATLPSNTTYFRQLFLQPLSEQGNASFVRRVSARSEVMVYDKTNPHDTEHSIIYSTGQVLPSYHNQEDVLATLFHCWTATTHRIRSITAANSTLTLYQAPHVDIPRCEHASGKRFLIEDALEELSVGEFYFDRVSKVLTYLPLAGETLEGTSLWAPQLITVLSIDAAAGATDVSVQDLSIVHGAADMSGFFTGDCDGQSATNLRSGVLQVNGSVVPGARAVTANIDRVEVAHTGSIGVVVGGMVRSASLTYLTVHDTGAGAVRVGTTALQPPTLDYDATRATDTPGAGAFGTASATALGITSVTLADSDLSDGGHVYKMGPGVQLDDCTNCTVTHNAIHDFHYTGISTGYGFQDNRIVNSQLSFNHIHGIGTQNASDGLSDLGCVYTWGGRQTLRVHDNLCHDVASYNYGGWGFYNDQTTQDVHWVGNAVHSTLDACYHNHEGVNVVVANNILVGQGLVLRSAAPSPPPTDWHAAANITRNILVTHSEDVFQSTDVREWALSQFDDNVYHRADGQGISFPGGVPFSKWQAVGAGSTHGGQDKHSVEGDPQFDSTDPNQFGLKPTSPALKLGFQPLNLSTVGPRSATSAQ